MKGLLVVDEAYVDFADRTALPLLEKYSNVLVLRTFSKSFSLCGMRVGLAFAAPAVIDALGKVKDSYNLNRLSQAAAVAALDDYAHMQQNAERIKATRSSLTAELRKRGFEVPDSHTNFVLARLPGKDLRPLQQNLKSARACSFATSRAKTSWTRSASPSVQPKRSSACSPRSTGRAPRS